jgi:hypothetical protein
MRLRRAKWTFYYSDVGQRARHGEMKKVKLWEVDFAMSRGETIQNKFDQNADICIGRVNLSQYTL